MAWMAFCAETMFSCCVRHDLADGIQGVDLRADVAILRGHVGDRGIEHGQGILRIGLRLQVGHGEVGRFLMAPAVT